MPLTTDQKRVAYQASLNRYTNGRVEAMRKLILKAQVEYEEAMQLPIFEPIAQDHSVTILTPHILAKGDEFDHDFKRWRVIGGNYGTGSGLMRYEVGLVGLFRHAPYYANAQWCIRCGHKGSYHDDQTFLEGKPTMFLDHAFYNHEQTHGNEVGE